MDSPEKIHACEEDRSKKLQTAAAWIGAQLQQHPRQSWR
ncbi:hypothetical protein FHY15_000935 [Xanthomonas arboricola]|nr:hypothetical protein [Xanthomonas arboricola]NJC03388.1 hypothetical protein [Xanthomonas arboricola]